MNPPPKKFKRDLFRIVLVVSAFGFAVWLVSQPHVRENLLDITKIKASLAAFGGAGMLVFVGVCAALNGFGVPRLWISAVAGTLYGALIGSALAHGATLLGATLNFYTGRLLLRGPVKRRLPNRLRKWYDRFELNGFRWILYARLFPLSNATLVNLICGASKVRFRDFIAATFLGYLPFSIAFALFGSSVGKQKYWQLAVGAALFAVVLGTRFLWKKYFTGTDTDEEDDEGEEETKRGTAEGAEDAK